MGSPFDPSTISGLVADFSAASARSLTGTDHAISVPGDGSDLSISSNAIRLDRTNGWSMAFWLYNAGWSGGPTFAGIEGGDGGFRLDGNLTRFLVFDMSHGVVGNVNAGYNPAVGEWDFFALTIDTANNRCGIRRNRGGWTYSTLTGTPAPGTAALTLGTGAAGPLTGSIGSLLIARQVLTDADFDEVFGNPGGASYAGLSAGLQAKTAEFWGFSESSGNRIGSKASLALVPSGTVTRVSGPAAALPTATGIAVDDWISNGTTARLDLSALGSARPTWVAAADSPAGRPAIRFADSGTVAMTGAGSFDLQSHTIVAVGRSLSRNGIHDTVYLGDLGTYSNLRDYSSRPVVNATGSSGTEAAFGLFDRSRDSDIRLLASDATGILLRQNGNSDTFTAASAGTASGIAIGPGQYSAAEDIERVLIYSRRLTSSEITTIEAGLRALYPIAVPSTTQPVVLWTGNSIHYGIDVSAVAHDIPAVAMGLLDLPYGSRWIDLSIPGQSTPECTANDPGRVTPYRHDARPATIWCNSELTNDIYLYGATAEDAYAHAQSLAAAMQVALPVNASGIMTTCLPRGGTYTVRNTLNTTLRADFATPTAYPHVFAGSAAWALGLFLADWAAEPTMGPDGAETNATYYDGLKIHPVDAGVALLAPITANAFRAAGVIPPTPPPSQINTIAPSGYRPDSRENIL
jgi:hypothetical protein